MKAVVMPRTEAEIKHEIERMSEHIEMALAEMQQSQARIEQTSEKTRSRLKSVEEALDRIAAR